MVHFVDARQGRQTRAITGDVRGEFFIWDIGNAQVMMLQANLKKFPEMLKDSSC